MAIVGCPAPQGQQVKFEIRMGGGKHLQNYFALYCSNRCGFFQKCGLTFARFPLIPPHLSPNHA